MGRREGGGGRWRAGGGQGGRGKGLRPDKGVQSPAGEGVRGRADSLGVAGGGGWEEREDGGEGGGMTGVRCTQERGVCLFVFMCEDALTTHTPSSRGCCCSYEHAPGSNVCVRLRIVRP